MASGGSNGSRLDFDASAEPVAIPADPRAISAAMAATGIGNQLVASVVLQFVLAWRWIVLLSKISDR